MNLPATLLFIGLAFSSGCSAVQTSLEYSDLEIKAAVERPIFIREQTSRRIVLSVDCPVEDFKGIAGSIAGALVGRGYDVYENGPGDIYLSIYIRDGGMAKYSARAVQGGKDYSPGIGAIGGAGVGLLKSGDAIGALAGGVAGLAAGSLTDVTLSSWVYLGVLDVHAFIEVRERVPSASGTGFVESQTRVNVRAKQAGLDWAETAPLVEAVLAKELALLVPKRTQD